MKSSEIATILLVVIIGATSAFFVGNLIWGNPGEKTYKIQYMDPISNEFVEPSREIFNKDAINPTTQILIGKDSDNINVGEVDKENNDNNSEQN